MKSVFVAFDSVSHQPKSTNMISMLQERRDYSIDSSYVDEIKDYIDYYNNFRYQWNLKKMTPVSYRNHLLASIA